MKKLILTTFVLLSFYTNLIGQTNKFNEIDELIKTNSMIDAIKALNMLKEYNEKDIIDSEYWLRYSKACYVLYNYEDSKSAINKAIELTPNSSLYHFEKGMLLNRIGNPDSALTSFERAVQINPEGEYYYWKGIVNQQLDNLIEAENDYKISIDKGFETPELYNNLAIISLKSKKITEGFYQINRALELNDKYAQAYSLRSQYNLFFFNVDSACEDKAKAYNLGYIKVFEIPDSVCNGSDFVKWRFIGEVCYIKKLYSQAIKVYTKLIENDYYHPDFFLNRGYCYYLLKDYVNAEKDYKMALTFPNVTKDLLYDNMSLLYFEQNNYVKSIEYSSKRIKLNPENQVPYIDRGLCYRKLKKYKEAERDFNKSLEIKPDFFRAYAYRAFLFLELGELQKSLDDASKSVEINPKYAYGYIVLAQVKYELGIPDFCIDLYNAKKHGEPDAEEYINTYCD